MLSVDDVDAGKNDRLRKCGAPARSSPRGAVCHDLQTAAITDCFLMRVAGVQVFFFRDGAQFVDLAHAVKGNPINRLNDAWRQVCAGLLQCAGRSHCLFVQFCPVCFLVRPDLDWRACQADFFSWLPESMNMITYLLDDVGIPQVLRSFILFAWSRTRPARLAASVLSTHSSCRVDVMAGVPACAALVCLHPRLGFSPAVPGLCRTDGCSVTISYCTWDDVHICCGRISAT